MQCLFLGQDALGDIELAKQFGTLEGFLDEIVAAGLVAQQAGFAVVVPGDEEHGNIPRFRVVFQAAAQRVAVNVRHGYVEQEKIRFGLGQTGQTSLR